MQYAHMVIRGCECVWQWSRGKKKHIGAQKISTYYVNSCQNLD